MNCLKCGRETSGERVFCDDCLLEMEKYPVRPGTLVHLPRRKESAAARKTTKRRTVSPEDQVKAMRRLIRRLILALVICIALILAMVYPSISYLMEDHFAIGQNYSSITPSTAPAPAEAAD